jgi:hypothetical protein
MRLLQQSVRRFSSLAGSGRVAHIGPAFGGAGARTVAIFGMWGAMLFSSGYLILNIGLAPYVADFKFSVKQTFPKFFEKDPEEMD